MTNFSKFDNKITKIYFIRSKMLFPNPLKFQFVNIVSMYGESIDVLQIFEKDFFLFKIDFNLNTHWIPFCSIKLFALKSTVKLKIIDSSFTNEVE